MMATGVSENPTHPPGGRYRGIGLLLIALALAMATVFTGAPSAVAQSASPPGGPTERWQSRHSAMIAGRRVRYTATAELVPVASKPGSAPDATFFVTSYVVDRPGGASPRPVIFAFNGGPGSSSIWLHLKLLGPREVRFGDDLAPRPTPPFSLADNADSPLDVADIVLIDPPGTGHARLLSGTDPSRYYGVQGDAVAMAGLIQQWINANGRWNSPKYLLGESYGTIRAVIVADLLAGGGTTGKMDGIALNGVILMGQSLDVAAAAHSDRAYLTGFPALAVTAWYHGKASAALASAVAAEDAARAFVRSTYLHALFEGDRLSSVRRGEVALELGRLTGLAPELVDRLDLRIETTRFARELLANKQQVLGLYDSRMTLRGSGDPANLADDPSMGQITPGYVAAIGTYLHDELGVTRSDPYIAIDFAGVNAAWDWGNGKGAPVTVNFAPRLAAAMRRNPGLRALFVSGRYDLVTPAAEARYVADHNDLPAERTTLLDLDAGHMPYLGPSRPALARALRSFLARR